MDCSKIEIDKYAAKLIKYKAGQLVRRVGFTKSDFDDLQQEMTLDLLCRLSKYDPSKASLNTFVARIVDRKVSTLIRHRRQKKRDCRIRIYSLDAEFDDQNGQQYWLDEVLSQDAIDGEIGRYDRPEVERIDLRLELSLVLDDLPEDLSYLARRLQTRTVAEIACELGVPRSTLYEKGIARLRKIFEDKGLREYLADTRHIEKEPGK